MLTTLKKRATKSDVQLAAELGVARTTVLRHRQRRGIQPVKPRRAVDWDDVFFVQRLHEELTSQELADKFGVNRSAVNKALKRRQLRSKPPMKTKADWKQVFASGLHLRHGVQELAEMFDASPRTIRRRIWEYEGSLVPKRAEAIKAGEHKQRRMSPSQRKKRKKR